MERQWKEPQNVNRIQSLLLEKTGHSYVTEHGEIVNILNIAFTIVMST